MAGKCGNSTCKCAESEVGGYCSDVCQEGDGSAPCECGHASCAHA